MMNRRRQSYHRCLLFCACLLFAASAWWEPWYAQEPTVRRDRSGELGQEEPADEPEVDVIVEQVPLSPREELLLAIELKDVEAARGALERGAGGQISTGNPSPLATAALHDDLRMVVLLLDAGGDPSRTKDSPLEEAVRNENTRMVELLMRAGARVPSSAAGQELFRLAQRGRAATELSGILLDHNADADQCLAAATGHGRVELMTLCLNRGAEIGSLPAELNPLSVALANDASRIVDQILASGSADRILISAFTDVIAAGREDLVERALAAGAVPAFEHFEAAVENSQPDIALFLLNQSPPGDGSELRERDVESLIQRASDLGFDRVAAGLRRRSGLTLWARTGWLPLLLAAVVAAGLILLTMHRLGRRRKNAVAAAERTPASFRRAPASRPARDVQPMAPGVPPADPRAASPVAPTEVLIEAPTDIDQSPAATLPVGAIPMMPSITQDAAEPGALARVPAQDLPPRVVTASAAPAVGNAVTSPPVATTGSSMWQVAPEPTTETEPVAVPPERVPGAATPRRESAIELRMPDVDLNRDADAVFEAARAASSGATVRPDAPDRRQVVLVAPSRVNMLRSCPAPGSLAPEELAMAEQLAGLSPAKNIAAIAYTDLDAMNDEISRAIPFFDLLRKLGYLGHAVWIFEGHVSAMAAGCRDADVLIVDDGMMPYLPGNWRSVATRVMRGADVHLFERKTGSLRRLA